MGVFPNHNTSKSIFDTTLYEGFKTWIKRKKSSLNPNPKNFQILKHESCNGHVVVEIQYPDCDNYEGRKIILFRDTNWGEIAHLNMVDPHFTSANVPKPFARFEPTEEGWKYAVKLCYLL